MKINPFFQGGRRRGFRGFKDPISYIYANPQKYKGKTELHGIDRHLFDKLKPTRQLDVIIPKKEG